MGARDKEDKVDSVKTSDSCGIRKEYQEIPNKVSKKISRKMHSFRNLIPFKT